MQLDKNKFITATEFLKRYGGRQAALYYLNSEFLPRAQQDQAHGNTRPMTVFTYYCSDDYPNESAQNFMKSLQELLEEGGWKTSIEKECRDTPSQSGYGLRALLAEAKATDTEYPHVFTQADIEDIAVFAEMRGASVLKIGLKKEALAAYNKAAFAKERIILSAPTKDFKPAEPANYAGCIEIVALDEY